MLSIKPFLPKAEESYRGGPMTPEETNVKLNLLTADHKGLADSVSVDAACSSNPGIMEYREYGRQIKLIFHLGPFRKAPIISIHTVHAPLLEKRR
jgi:hypothetical protein